MQESKTLHYILGISLVMIAVFVVASLVMINSQADNNQTNTSVNIADAAPVILELRTSSGANGGTGISAVDESTGENWVANGIPLISGGNKNFYLNGIVQDTNGNPDISQVRARFWRKSASNMTGQDGPGTCVLGTDGNAGVTKNNCFETVCSIDTNSPGDGVNKKRFSCAMLLPYYTAGTAAGAEYAFGSTTFDDYTAEIAVTGGAPANVVTYIAANFDADASGSGGTGEVRRINTLTSLSIPTATINYGNALSVGQSLAGGATKDVAISQAGNDVADVYVYAPTTGGDLGCTISGSISADLQKFSQSSGTDYASATVLPKEATSTTTAAGYSIGYKPNSATAVNDSAWFNIQIPTGVAGVCSGKINFITFPV